MKTQNKTRKNKEPKLLRRNRSNAIRERSVYFTNNFEQLSFREQRDLLDSLRS